MKEASSWGCEEKEDHKQKTLGPHPDFKNSHCFCLAYFLTIKEIGFQYVIFLKND
jgi:hypothetical protein